MCGSVPGRRPAGHPRAAARHGDDQEGVPGAGGQQGAAGLCEDPQHPAGRPGQRRQDGAGWTASIQIKLYSYCVFFYIVLWQIKYSVLFAKQHYYVLDVNSTNMIHIRHFLINNCKKLRFNQFFCKYHISGSPTESTLLMGSFFWIKQIPNRVQSFEKGRFDPDQM